jgi:hypothetical protein
MSKKRKVLEGILVLLDFVVVVGLVALCLGLASVIHPYAPVLITVLWVIHAINTVLINESKVKKFDRRVKEEVDRQLRAIKSQLYMCGQGHAVEGKSRVRALEDDCDRYRKALYRASGWIQAYNKVKNEEPPLKEITVALYPNHTPKEGIV